MRDSAATRPAGAPPPPPPSAEMKLLVAQRLRDTARQLVAAGVRLQYPELDARAVEATVREVFARADT